MKKIITSVLMFATLAPALTFASVEVQDVKLNGYTYLEVKPGKTVTVDVLLKHTRGTDLKCLTFLAFPDEQNRVVIEDNTTVRSVPTMSTTTFSFKVPETEGNYDLVVKTYDNDDCNQQDLNDSWAATDKLKVTSNPEKPVKPSIAEALPTIAVGASDNQDLIIALQMKILVLLQQLVALYQLSK